MQHRNYILFIVLSMAVLLGWPTLMSRFMPRKPPVVAKNLAKPDQPRDAAKDVGAEQAVAAKDAAAPAGSAPATASAASASAVDAAKKPPAAVAAPPEKQPLAPAVFEPKTILLGSSDPETGYFFRAELTTTGASVAKIELNDPRYRELKNTNAPLKIVGDNRKALLRTFNSDVPEVDVLLQARGKTLAETDWSVAAVEADAKQPTVNSAVTFRYPSPDGELVIEKRYSVARVDDKQRSSVESRDTQTSGYLLDLEFTIRNVGRRPRTASYVLQGPVGLPLENADNTRKFRDLKLGFLNDSGTLKAETITATQAVSNKEKDANQEWKAPLRFIGVDIQYFAALVLPVDDQLKSQTIERSMPVLLDKPAAMEHTDLSIQLESKKIDLPAVQAVTHKYQLFAGPKRTDLLQPLQAETALDFGWFAVVSNGMIFLLNWFHDWGIPYGVAIIFLTVLVRGCLFPVSLRQTAQAQRMKEMQPKLQEMKKKYANDREKLAMANMQLMREHKINPLGGCLPMFLQLPIFIGLYQAINNAVDLRLAPFLYFNNLAGPDALFQLPFHLWIPVPFRFVDFGSDFNLLPIITVALFVVQQKMFMPPPTDEQQAMQYKMMNVMMIVMGVMFYNVPAGLCVYFISSSVWGLSERKLLEWWKSRRPAAPPTAPFDDDKPSPPAKASEKNPAARGAAGSLWQRLLNVADAASAEATSGSKGSISRRETTSKKNGKKPR